MFDPINSLKGASQTMCDEYRGVLETGSAERNKYPIIPVMQDLADTIMGRGGIKKDLPLLELCNLVFAINQTLDGRPPRHRLLSFFTEISQYTARAPIYRQWFRDNQTRITDHFLINQVGINITYPDGQFFIHFSRMPLLNALFEFLFQMDAFSFSEEFLEKMEEIQSESASDETLTFRAVQDASNKLSSRLHSYRKVHVNKIFLAGKFERARENFLKDQKLSVTDDGILEFWIEHVGISGFREYQPVFRHVMEFVTAFKDSELEQEFKNPLSIDEKSPEGFSIEIAAGIDAGERQDNLPNQAAAHTTSTKYRVSETLEDWVSPLSILAEEPASRIKFLKNNSELKPLENIMTYGPLANEFPISMLRLDTFGRAQSSERRIYGSKNLPTKINCDKVEDYSTIMTRLKNLLDHVHKLQKACIWAISKDEELEQIAEDNKAKIIRFPGAYKTKQDFEYDLPQNGEPDDPELITKILSEGVSAFRSFRRKGFDTELLDELTHRAGFSVGLGALRDIGLVLERFIDFVEQKLPGELDQIFFEDKKAFQNQFDKIYGAE